ncbi:MAG: hypothetical protein E3J35_02550 [Methanomassiliicoccales archaeon]|nr:MAG: hypothetical protein E3J35_02550 [Methanomassiliicoccales archaeon]
MKGTNTAKVLAMGIAFVIALGVLPLVMADDNYINPDVTVSITPSGYPWIIYPDDKTFIPGDSVEVNLEATTPGQDTLDDVYDIIVLPNGDSDWGARVKIMDDLPIDEDGFGSDEIGGETTENLRDACYDVYVGRPDWIQNEGDDVGAGINNWYTRLLNAFCIKLYTIKAETASKGYIPGDDVRVFYSIVSLMDGSLVSEDTFPGLSFDDLEWGVWSEDDETQETNEPLDESSGFFEFQITPGGSSSGWYEVWIWANGTYGDKTKDEILLEANKGNWDFTVADLDLYVNVDRATYQLDSVVQVTVVTFVEGTTPKVPEPEVKVEIEIMEGTGTAADAISGYGGEFLSDAAGKVEYVFSLPDSDFDEDETYTARANVGKSLKEDTEDITFDIKAGGRTIAVDMVFNEEVYTSGDKIQIDVQTALPEGASGVSAYSLRIWAGFQMMWLEVSSNNIFGYDIPENFEGRLNFHVDVYNPDGDSGHDADHKSVRHVVVLINAEPQLYSAGQTITANYQLKSNRVEANEERFYFYNVTDPGGNIVLEGEVVSTAKTGSFQYTVPDVAASSYFFGVIANVEIIVEDGTYDRYRVSEDAVDRVDRISGYDLEITVDNAAVSPGDRVTIHYEITPRGDEGLPDKFVFSYGMSNGQTFTWQSDKSSGDIFYTIPSGVNEGDVGFLVTARDGDGNKIGEAGEMLRIQESPNPFEYVRLGDIPLISIILLILVILLIIIMLFRRPSAARAKAEEPELGPPAEEEAPPPEEAEPMEEAGPLSINCKSCGAAIDITTSKRPIEVMCPSCGETEMVE